MSKCAAVAIVDAQEAAVDGVAAHLASLRADLSARDAAFESASKRCPSRADIAADAAWSAAFEMVKHLERTTAVRQDGGCSFYVARKRRYCASRARIGDDWCSEHAADAGERHAALLARGSAGHEQGGVTVRLGHVANGPGGPALAAGAAGPGGEAFAPPGVEKRKVNLTRRMKHLTDPLRVPPLLNAPDWAARLDDARGPTLVDVGCAKGRFVQALATTALGGNCAAAALLGEADAAPLEDWNFVGMEIFAPLAHAANDWASDHAAAQGRRNAAFLACNAVCDDGAELGKLCAGLNVRAVTLQFPDPWGAHAANAAAQAAADAAQEPAAAVEPGGEAELVESAADGAKRRFDEPKFRRRRLLGSAGVARAVAAVLPPGGVCYAASDVLDVALEMRESLSSAGAFVDHAMHLSPNCVVLDRSGPAPKLLARAGENAVTWLPRTPFGVPTERELVCERGWRPVYRFLLVRTDAPIADAPQTDADEPAPGEDAETPAKPAPAQETATSLYGCCLF